MTKTLGFLLSAFTLALSAAVLAVDREIPRLISPEPELETDELPQLLRTNVAPMPGSLIGFWSQDGMMGSDVIRLVSTPAQADPSGLGYPFEPRRIFVKAFDGTFRTEWGQNCMAGHGDQPSSAQYVMLLESRILKRVTKGGHSVRPRQLADVILQRVRY